MLYLRITPRPPQPPPAAGITFPLPDTWRRKIKNHFYLFLGFFFWGVTPLQGWNLGDPSQLIPHPKILTQDRTIPINSLVPLSCPAGLLVPVERKKPKICFFYPKFFGVQHIPDPFSPLGRNFWRFFYPRAVPTLAGRGSRPFLVGTGGVGVSVEKIFFPKKTPKNLGDEGFDYSPSLPATGPSQILIN